MTLVSSLPDLQLNAVGERQQAILDMARSAMSAAGSNIQREIIEEMTSPLIPHEAVAEERVFVAVGKEMREHKATVAWAMKNARMKKIGILHVHQPAQMIPTPIGRFPADRLKPSQVQTYRAQERKKMQESLDEYRRICARGGVESENIVIEMEEVERGILELVKQHGVTMLVMGAAANKHYSKKMRVPKSKKATVVSKEAPLTCNIWFICDGKLVCTREASLDGSGVYVTPPSPVTTTNSTTSSPILPRSRTVGPSNELILQSPSASPHILFRSSSEMRNNISAVQVLGTRARSSMSSVGHLGDMMGPNSASPSANSTGSSDETARTTSSAVDMESNKRGLPSQVNDTHVQEGFGSSPSVYQKEGAKVDDQLFEQLQQAMLDTEKCRRDAYEESVKRRSAEKLALDTMRKLKQAEAAYQNELKLRKEVEEMFSQEMLKLESTRTQLKQAMEELQCARACQSSLEREVADSSQIIRKLTEKLSEATNNLKTLKHDLEVREREKEEALRSAYGPHTMIEEGHSSSLGPEAFSQFSYLEIEKATQGLDASFKIGGGYGSVYKGLLRHTPVAIKILNPASSQGRSEFQQEMEILTRVRHPNMVTLIGTCPEAKALIYEYLHNGSLEDRLLCKHNSPPLSWQIRTRILYEVCAALVFLHSVQPHGIVHGDLKPDNILLDANYVAKLGDFGISRPMRREANAIGHSTGSDTTTQCWMTEQPRGTISYIDPEFMQTGVLTPKSDVYSFGVVILRVLTRLPALRITMEVKKAVEGGRLDRILDETAGDWPFVLARQLACLGLRCCEMNRRERPDLESEVWRVLEPMMGIASSAALTCVGSPDLNRVPTYGSPELNRVPTYFICPIFQEIMQDPRVAGDGFTYEGEAIKGWLDGGHNTSPMTNLKLTHKDLIPNHALRSTIKDWLQLQRSK